MTPTAHQAIRAFASHNWANGASSDHLAEELRDRRWRSALLPSGPRMAAFSGLSEGRETGG